MKVKVCWMAPLWLWILQFVTVLSTRSAYSDPLLFDKKTKRPSWAGSLRYEYEINDNDETKMILKVSGVVIPMQNKDMEKAPAPPDPFNGAETGGDTGYEKGHIIGLILAGTDHKFNIVPQTAGWMNNGAWNKLENQIYNLAFRLSGWDTAATLQDIAQKPRPKKIVKLFMEINQWQGHDNKIPSEYDGRVEIVDTVHPTPIQEAFFVIQQPLAPVEPDAIWDIDPASFQFRDKQGSGSESVSDGAKKLIICLECIECI